MGNYPLALSPKVEDNKHRSKLLFGSFIGSVRTGLQDEKQRAPKPKSQTRGSKEGTVAEEGERE